MRAFPIALAVILLVAGCSAPAAPSDDSTSADPPVAGTTQPTEEVSTNGTSRDGDDGTEAPTAGTPRPDPDEDVEGWEGGYWYDESLAVTVEDGLNESELDAVVARAMARVEHLRAVEFREDVEVRVISREAYRDGSGGNGGGGEDRTFEGVRYRALFLVGDGANATDRERDTRNESVLGYYDANEDRIVVVADAASPTLDEVTLAQELTHAYQFRNVPLRVPRDPTDDEVRALVALIEGDANYVDRLYERQCEGPWECVRPSDDGAGDTAGDGNDGAGGADEGDGAGDADGTPRDGSGVHMGLYLLQFFPYAEGEELVRETRARGGWAAVMARYEDPPRSSEQVIHPEKIGRDDPEDVAVPDVAEDPWRRVGRSDGGSAATIGEAGIATMFMYTAYDDRPGAVVSRSAFLNVEDGRVNATDPLDYAINYSTGWAGD
ncbi:MAG: Hvo_1808 family surface protein, partial [Halobacteriales archaeon]